MLCVVVKEMIICVVQDDCFATTNEAERDDTGNGTRIQQFQPIHNPIVPIQ